MGPNKNILPLYDNEEISKDLNKNIPPLSDNEVFNNLMDKDQTTEIVGSVTEVHASKNVGSKSQFKLFKFVLSNNLDKKIACCIWGDELITKYEPNIRLNRILHLSGGFTKAVKSNYFKESDGFVPFEITVMPSTVITYYDVENANVSTPQSPKTIDFDSIKDHGGTLVTITGYLKQNLRAIESRFGNMSYGSSAITNGEVKINVVVTKYAPLNIEIGTRVTVTGQLSDDDGGLTTITCKDITAFSSDLQSEKMSLTQLLKGNKFPKRKAE